MKTGAGEMNMDAYFDAADDIFRPVMESAIVMAGHYANACGRQSLSGKDIELGLMYAARNIAGKQLGTLYPEIYEEDEEDEEDEGEEEDEEEWTEYSGTDEMSQKMNECAATFDSWEPEEFFLKAIKNSILKIKSANLDQDQTE
jgi:hypothetical protein